MPGIGRASPSNSVSTPAIMRKRVDLPEPLRPSTPILAPGKKLREISLRISRLGGTTLPTRFMLNTYWAIRVLLSSRMMGDRASEAVLHGLDERCNWACKVSKHGGYSNFRKTPNRGISVPVNRIKGDFQPGNGLE